MLTKRDERIINLISTLKCVNSSHVQRVFGISPVVANRRLLRIIQTEKEVKRTRDSYTMNYIYYCGKPTKHKLLVSEFYCKLLQEGGKIVEFIPEYTVGDVRSDAFCRYQKGGYEYLICLEVQLSHEPVNIQKYERLLLSRSFPWRVFPRIVVVSDKRIDYKGELRVIWVDAELSNFSKVLM